MNISNKQLDKEVMIHDNASIINCEFGLYTEVGMSNFLENSTLGDYSYTGQFCFIQNTIVGRFSNIAAMVRIGPTDHPYDRPSLHHFTYRKKMYGFSDDDDSEFFNHRENRITSIGHDTWIGHGAIISPEVTVGHGAVIGAGAVVTKDVEPYAIVVGVPAKEIKKRFSDEVIEALLDIKWWDWSHEKIKECIEDFHLPIEEFVRKHYQN
ncbi:chloramphenicol acetyltransferase [Jeotgalicoccus sp. FSL K6-3177]|uniref:chloramphenicol acetyltransferase n=1 Tax=Jeotgalicoccus sp. FSL K6-3177 TaxID=2921494 RepID=UPI0030FD6C8F